MKQKFYTLLLTAVFGLTGMNAWAQLTQVDGVYQIGSAQDLVDFATKVNTDQEYTAQAVLTDDIDMDGVAWPNSIGDWQSSHMFKGKFDGQGHSITNLTFTTARDYHGLFGVVGENAEIKNFTIEGNITVSKNSIGVIGYTRDDNVVISNIHSKLNFSGASGKRVGGIVGNANQASNKGTSTIDRCTYSGTLSVSGTGNYGGIVGYVLNNSNVKTTITNCLFDGKIINSGGAAECGGIAGYVGANLTKVTIKNCLSIGTVSADVSGQFYGVVKNKANSIVNSYYQGSNINGTETDAVTPTTLEATSVTDAQLASGAIAFLLNENVNGGTNWFQTLATDASTTETTYTGVQYVATVNGEDNDPSTQTTDIIIVDNGNNTINIVLKNFSVIIQGQPITVDEINLDNVATSVDEDGLTHFDVVNGAFTIPTEKLPTNYQQYVSMGLVSFENIPFTLHGKKNATTIYSTLDITIASAIIGNKEVSLIIGPDFTVDKYPKPYGTAIVYENGSFNCDMTPKAGTDIVYSNTNAAIIDPHSFTDGFCTVCGAIDETYMAANADGYFEIANEKQLVWFAAYVNQVSVAAKGKLMNNIALTKAWTTPIGTGTGNVTPGASTYTGIAYTGTFDGQEYAITGFNAEGTGHLGLFGDANGATIKNFSISGNLTVTSGYGGGVVAWPVNSTIENVHSALVISVPNSGTHHIGGIVGSARGGNTIDRCSFTGSLTVAAGSTDNFAGIAAYITNGDKITNCANFADVTFSDAGCAAGGLIGYLNSTSAYVQNCLTIGNIIFDGEGTPNYGAAILGRTKNTNFEKITNNYWLEGSAYAAAKNSDGSSDPLATGSVTIDQLVSGEVAYLLGEAWGQLIGTDEVPVLGGDTPVFYVGAAGYATMYDTTSGYELNGDVKAYVATASGNWLVLAEIENVPESTPVILKGTYYNLFEQDLPAITVANDLLGTAEDTEADGTMFVLAKPEGMDIGFYKAEGTIPAGKAYYQSTSGAKGFTFAGDDATAISEVSVNSENTKAIFNVAGQRISKMQKGINIVNGKKVLF